MMDSTNDNPEEKASPSEKRKGGKKKKNTKKVVAPPTPELPRGAAEIHPSGMSISDNLIREDDKLICVLSHLVR
jgi:hypothetical protein